MGDGAVASFWLLYQTMTAIIGRWGAALLPTSRWGAALLPASPEKGEGRARWDTPERESGGSHSVERDMRRRPQTGSFGGSRPTASLRRAPAWMVACGAIKKKLTSQREWFLGLFLFLLDIRER